MRMKSAQSNGEIRAAIRNLLLLSGSSLTPTQIFDAYVAGLSPFLWYHFRETSGTNAVNSGSGAAAYNGTYTPGTGAVGQTGQLGANEAYSFDKANSKVQIATGAEIADYTTHAFAMLVNMIDAGESNFGFLFAFGSPAAAAGRGCLFFAALTAISINLAAATTDANSKTNSGLSANTWTWLFFNYDHAGDKKYHVYKGIAGAVTEFGYLNQVAAVGAITTNANPLVIGNTQDQSLTTNGKFDEFIMLRGSIFSAAQMLQITLLSGMT